MLADVSRFTETPYIELRLDNADERLGILHRVSSLNLADAIHQRFDVRLQLLQLIENSLTLLNELLGHTLRQIQALSDVRGVINHVGSVDGLQHEVEEDILVVDLKRQNKSRLG